MLEKVVSWCGAASTYLCGNNKHLVRGWAVFFQHSWLFVVCCLLFVYFLLFESTIYSSASVQYTDGLVTVFRNSSSSLRPGGVRLVSKTFSQVALGATRELPLCLGAAAMSASRFDAKSAHNRRPCNGHCNPSMASLATAA